MTTKHTLGNIKKIRKYAETLLLRDCEIAEKMGFSTQNVQRLRHLGNIKNGSYLRFEKDFEKYVSEIKFYVSGGKSDGEIARILNFDRTVISTVRRNENIASGARVKDQHKRREQLREVKAPKKEEEVTRKCNICKKEFTAANKFIRFCSTCRSGTGRIEYSSFMQEHSIKK